MRIKRGLPSVLALTLVLAACSAPTTGAMMAEATPTMDAMMQKGTSTADAMMAPATPTADAMMMQATPTADAMMAPATPTADAMMMQVTPAADAMMAPAMPTADTTMMQATPTADAMMGKDTMSTPMWFSARLTDVNTGRSLRVTDFQGKVILVEAMAVWCTTCFQQQQQIQALHGLLNKSDDLVSLSLDIDLNENDAILKTYVNSRGFDWMYAVAPADVAREIGNLYGDQFLNPPSAPMFIIDRQGKVHLLQFGVKSAQDLKAAAEPYLRQGA